MVLDSYLHERQHQQDNGHSLENAQGRTSPPLSTLAQYGCWVRMLPGPESLLQILQRPRIEAKSQQTLAGQDNDPTAHELLRHLYQHCPFIQVRRLNLRVQDYDCGLLGIIADYVVPSVHYVHIWGRLCELSSLKHLLERCSSLKELTLDIDLSEASGKGVGIEGEQTEESEDHWPSLEVLRILRCSTNPKEFWSWLWRRCRCVKMLNVRRIHALAIQNLREGTLGFMTNLDAIQLGQDHIYARDLTDDEVGVTLSGSRKGWKTVEIQCTAEFQNEAMDSLAKHFHTLEKFCMCKCHDVASIDLALLLSSSPKLRCLEIIQHDYNGGDLQRDDWPTVFKAKKFIDLIPNTSVLKTWLCESSLTVLKIFISDIPRADLYSKEAYPGEGREIQGQVYDRLARLTNLETLWLGLDIDATDTIQCDCLEMSLDSGLYKLSTLTKLKELDISRMMTRISLREVQWMTEHWPQLRSIYGLDWDDIQRERDVPLSAMDNRLGAPAVLLRDPGYHHHWRIENRDDDTVVISLRSPEGRRLFAAPLEKANHAFVLLNEEEFPWRLTSQGRELLIERGDNNYGGDSRLVLGQSPYRIWPPHADTQLWRPHDGFQLWRAIPANDGLEKETENHCGPRKLSRDSFYLQ
ncbi:MAG: hypothetical protein J3Q66DRAFT_413992 [Benniella sp.]|nr:MAG: hypothetical protein J3Q66DRAFT_413992 [Benniella sp.]